jgi:hypothetical protein
MTYVPTVVCQFQGTHMRTRARTHTHTHMQAHTQNHDFRSDSMYFLYIFEHNCTIHYVIVYFAYTSIYMYTWAPPVNIESDLPETGNEG